MWKGLGQDPGGGPDSWPPPGSSQELSDLKDQFEHQQVLIAQLKEMLRKNEQSNVTQEKVDEYMNTLSKRGGKAKKKTDDNKKTVDIPASQKINLLRQQVEENKARFAERGKSKKGIEDMVTQLKAQLDDSQHLISQTPLNLSLQDTKTDYSENSSSQELYMILLTKEKRISDLLAKVQKLESSNLDLQENLKEKDSVIDARTKAITLMTENLSRKGKTTLDTLDDTREQMRKMQENFVSLEADMKARQMKLLDDLRQKNYEIAELQELNLNLEKQLKEGKNDESDDERPNQEVDRLKLENSKLTQTITELEDKITKLQPKEEDINEEINKLKKQLDESNKNMIKVKAQHKSKIKELTKKIDAFKKIGDVNAEIVKLEAENGRLNQKIAELEEEKGSLQLKLVETDSAKGSEGTEHRNELEEKIQNQETQLEEKDKIITILESEISRSKTEIETLSEKLNSLSHLENAQVTSEMTSIQYEEQMEALETVKLQLQQDNENLQKDKENLLETIEQIKKEKQEISIKLDHYIQENMELIDKLEKLSAEKVSSAESIEIVEGLTQQEKLELEAYQKNLDIVAGKTSEENLPQVDLNESVNELTEETSELLQKIELFTVERREVMDKMEQLKSENLNLSLKIKEIENNRDVLAETYEQLQNEKEGLDVKIESIESENQTLKEKLNEENSSRIQELEEEIKINKNLLEEKLKELENLNEFLESVKSQLEERNQVNNQLNNKIIDLNRTLADLENDNTSLQMKITQIEEQKSNLQQILNKKQEELETVTNLEWENHRLLESKDNEISKLIKERDNTESVILDLQKTIKEKDENFHKLTNDLKTKYLNLQKQLEDNSGDLHNITQPLQAKVEELTIKNKEQLEKMKKIAANLKKKTQAYQELEDKLKENQHRHEMELKTSLQQLQDLESEVSRLQQQYDDKSQENQVLQEKNVELQNTISDLKSKFDRNQEVNLQQELLLTKENLGSVESSLQTKIQELEMIIETQESELIKTKERCSKLEEGISFVEERRLSLERKANQLGAQLEEKVITCEEISRSEDLLETRLAALTAHDEAIEKKLQEAITDNQDLNKHNQKLAEKNDKLKKRLEEFKDKLKNFEDQQATVIDLETQNENLKKQIHSLENELKNLQNDYERVVQESKDDFDKVNLDWQTQFDEVLQEKNELMIKCEKFGEELKEICEKEIGFNNELIDYKTKLENSELEIQNYEKQIRELSQERDEVENFKQLIAQKDESLRVLEEKVQIISSENKETEKLKLEIKNFENQIESLKLEKNNTEMELRRVIAEKETEIESYRKSASDTPSIFFDNNVPQDQSVSATVSDSKVQELEQITPQENQQTRQDDIPTFVWSGQTNDPFDFIESNVTQTQVIPSETLSQPTDNTLQELQDKIKTLECMLYNAGKEKEEAFDQCQQLTNELTRIIYEKQIQKASKDLESQIVQPQDTIDSSKNLQTLEFEQTKPYITSSLEAGPIVEEVCQPKQAYLCYAVDDSQILTEAQLVDTPAIRQELQELEFEKTKSADKPDEACVSKEAYVCYNTFSENDDGWGWGPEEAKLEEEHAQRNENLEILQNRIKVLEMERENHLEEIRQLQVKSGKLIKKLKELKVKNEELNQRKKSEGDLLNLDDAIQEELKLQIQQVEKKLKETSNELEKEKNEKLAILKRIDVLTSANERLVEMKEKQDIELLSWQQNCRDLTSKLQQFAWGDDGFSSSQQKSPEKQTESNTNKKIEELNETIKDLTLDNEELQALLEEQRKLRLESEKSTNQIDYSDFIKLQQNTESLNQQLQVNSQEKKELQEQINELIKKNSESSEKLDRIQQEKLELEALRISKEETIKQLNEKLGNIEGEWESLLNQLQNKNIEIDNMKALTNVSDLLQQEKEYLLQQLEEKNLEIQTLQTSLQSKQQNNIEKEHLQNEISQKNQELQNLKVSQDSILQEKEILFKELQEKNAQINTLRDSIDSEIKSLKEELNNQTTIAEALLTEKNNLSESIVVKDAEILRLTTTMEQMTQEWEMRINQRGTDVAESWKLHLETRESEFSQLEEVLRKEINELEEKTNGLVNENNELRKNVDAEIRNEVDRVAALQQQINDRQQYINELTRSLQEKQTEIENLQSELQTTKKYLDDEKEITDEIVQYLQNLSQETIERNKNNIIEKIKNLQKEKEEIKLNLVNLESDYSRILQDVQNLNSLIDERNQTITTLTNQLQEINNLKDYEHENIQNLQQNLLEYQQINTNLNQQLQTKNSRLEEKERELINLKQELEEKERQHIYAFESLSEEYRESMKQQNQEIESLKRRLNENDNHYEELLQNKELELQSVQLELQNHSQASITKNQQLDDLNLQLQKKLEECVSLEGKIEEQTSLLDEENRQLNELRAIIEKQVLKIEELKQELYQKSNDYDSLIAEMDISRASNKTNEVISQPKDENEDLTEPVSRAELDLALYMLHQRDVRCEELTVELTQLLEERDTLQLRLSNVIREKEELGRRIDGEIIKEITSASGAIPKVKTEIAQEVLDPLSTKLSELKTVGYKKDKTIVDEQELRRLQQFSIMQQHRDEASKLPPEAAARLVDASYTLSRDVQSPSKVLLNWLWGRSTPKVNNI